jgi:hypothetical protein
MMDQEFCACIDGTPLVKAVIVELAAKLPEDDATLDAWCEAVVTEQRGQRFLFLLLAAFHSGRRVDARHAGRGLALLPHPTWVGPLLWRMEGDLVAAVRTAVEETVVLWEAQATALFTAAARRARETGCATGKVAVPELMPYARALARQEKQGNTLCWVAAFAQLAGDANLDELLRRHFPNDERHAAGTKAARKLRESMPAAWEQPVLKFVNETLPRDGAIARGVTLRRAVERVGRNDPCPCGSGRKYKRCCVERDQERLRHSSEVAGKTEEEVRADLEPHLTKARLERLRPEDLARLDGTRIAPELRPTYFLALFAFAHFDRALEMIERIGWEGEMAEQLEDLIFYATERRRRDVVRRALALDPKVARDDDGTVRFSSALLLEEDDAEAARALIVEAARRVLTAENAKDMDSYAFELAYGLVISRRYQALGILAVRYAIPHVKKRGASHLLARLFEARDRLELPPDDPAADLLEQRFADEPPADSHREDAAALRAARARLEEKAAEVRRVKTELERARREVTRQEKRGEARTAIVSPTPERGDDERLRDLREKVQALKGELRDRHNERTTLRRELETAHADLEKLRAKSQSPAAENGAAADAAEERHVLPAEDLGNQPVRVIEFPRKFAETLRGFPRPVARAAMAMLGRLAGGEPAAFTGVVRLRECPDTLRQRIGIDHRLLFRLHMDRLEVIDFINRRDLERRLKTLRAG